jgi:hypothetical protein
MNHANSAVRRSVWEEHPYDESLPGLEDVAWANQVTAKGWRIGYRAEATVHHIHDETRSQTRTATSGRRSPSSRSSPGSTSTSPTSSG